MSEVDENEVDDAINVITNEIIWMPIVWKLSYFNSELLQSVTTIMNICMATGFFADKLEMSRITTIFKKEDQKWDNYRPFVFSWDKKQAH